MFEPAEIMNHAECVGHGEEVMLVYFTAEEAKAHTLLTPVEVQIPPPVSIISKVGALVQLLCSSKSEMY